MRNLLKITYSIFCGLATFAFLGIFTLLTAPSLFPSVDEAGPLFIIVGFFIVLIGGPYFGYLMSSIVPNKRHEKCLVYGNYLIGTLSVIYISCNIFFYYDIRKADFKIENSDYVIEIQIEPAHPYLAEYYKTLILKKGQQEIIRQELFMDTGGYLRTNLYKTSTDHYGVEGFFDAHTIDLSQNTIEPGMATTTSIFLGSFDYYINGFRFIPMSERPKLENDLPF